MAERAEIAIVGGGLAGASAALRLARAGREVVLFERERGTHEKVCGAFLAAPALAELAALGIDVWREGAVALSTVTLSDRRRAARVRLPFPAASLSRGRLDRAVLAQAARAGAAIREGEGVSRIEPAGAGVRVVTPAGSLEARTLVVATGKLNLRGEPRGKGLHGGLAGLKSPMALTPAGRAALGDGVDVVAFAGGYGGIQATEDGGANVCVAVSLEALRRHGAARDVFATLAHAGERAAAILEGAAPAGPLKTIGAIPYGFVRRDGSAGYFLGDQAAVIPSFCGEGMGIALVSARLAADAILEGRGSAAFQADFARRVRPRVLAATLLQRALCTPAGRGATVALAATAPALARTVAGAMRTPCALPTRTAQI